MKKESTILRSTFNFAGAVLTAIVMSNTAFAAGASASSNGYAGALLGLGAVNNSGGTNFTYGLGVGYKFNPQWSAGLDFTYNTFTVPSPLTANLTTILANLKYYCDCGFFGGLKFGAATVAYSGTGASGSASNFTFGPTVGYDYVFNGNWSVGGEGNLLWVNNSNPGVSVLQVLANLKYWF